MGWNIRRSAKPNDRRFTLPDTIDTVKCLTGVKSFTFDAAAEPMSHHASSWCGPLGVIGEDGCIGHDGFSVPWTGDVFCNPPWSQKYDWVEMAWHVWAHEHDFVRRYEQGVATRTITMVLPATVTTRTITMVLPATTDQAWWHQFVEPHRLLPVSDLRVWFLESRTQYGKPEDPTGATQGTPQFGSCILHWSRPTQS